MLRVINVGWNGHGANATFFEFRGQTLQLFEVVGADRAVQPAINTHNGARSFFSLDSLNWSPVAKDTERSGVFLRGINMGGSIHEIKHPRRLNPN